MPEDYQDLVLATYKEKCKERKLHLNLLKPTTVKLKRECLKKYDASDEAKDVFSDFFNKDKMDNISLILSQSDPGDFRALLNHINGITTRTDEKNSELLAWLIDFQPRPSTSYYKSFDRGFQEVIDIPDVRLDEIQTEITRDNDGGQQNLGEEESNGDRELEKQDGLVEEVKESIVGKTDPVPTEQPSDEENNTVNSSEKVYMRRFSPRQITIASILLFFIGSTSFIAWERMATSVRIPKAGENSMYWDGDHYEPVKDGAQEPGVTIIPLNIKTLQQQRKITLPDTLTKYSLGKVWYKGYGKDHEYFTNSGIYPPDTSRRLKPLSSGILKYSSYDRYLLRRLIWFLCTAFFISLCGYGASTLKKEIKKSEEEKKVNEEETVQSHGNELQATST
jgi:hypothetical protein